MNVTIDQTLCILSVKYNNTARWLDLVGNPVGTSGSLLLLMFASICPNITPWIFTSVWMRWQFDRRIFVTCFVVMISCWAFFFYYISCFFSQSLYWPWGHFLVGLYFLLVLLISNRRRRISYPRGCRLCQRRTWSRRKGSPWTPRIGPAVRGNRMGK